MRERVLITGGSGFVGACLTRELIAAGHEVHLLLRPEHRGWRLADIRSEFTAHSGDLREAAPVRRAVEACRPDVIYHLATHGAYPSQKDRAEIMAANVQGTVNLIDALGRREYRALVHAGSSSEYGHKPGPIRELDMLEPRSDYAIGKAAASHLCLAESYRGRPVRVVRLFSAYGPWEEPSRLVPYLMGCCLRGESPRVTAGSQPRDFIAIEDVIDLLQIAANEPATVGKVLHAGTGIQSRVRDMIEAVIEVSGRRVKARYGVAELKPDEPDQWVASIAYTRSLTGWQPRHSLRSGLRIMWDWYQAWAPVQSAA